MVWSDKTSSNSFKLREGTFRLDIGKKFCYGGKRDTGTGCWENLRMSYHWKCSVRLKGLWTGKGIPAHGRQGWTRRSFRIPSNPNPFVILRALTHLKKSYLKRPTVKLFKLNLCFFMDFCLPGDSASVKKQTCIAHKKTLNWIYIIQYRYLGRVTA